MSTDLGNHRAADINSRAFQITFINGFLDSIEGTGHIPYSRDALHQIVLAFCNRHGIHI